MGDNFDWYLQSIVNYKSSERAINFQMCPFSNRLPRNKSLQALWKARSSVCSFIDFLFQLITNSIFFSFWTQNASFCANLRKRCPFITTLSLKFCKIADRGLQIIKKADWKFIKKVDFTGAFTIYSCNWKYISILIINQNQIKNRGFKYILLAKWVYLTVLSMYENGFTTDFWKLFDRNNWNLLQKLVIFQERLKYEMVRSFLQILPKLQIRNLHWIYLENPGLNYYRSLDRNSNNKAYVNNTAKLKRNSHRLILVIDIDRDGNEALDIIEDNGLISFRFI